MTVKERPFRLVREQNCSFDQAMTLQEEAVERLHNEPDGPGLLLIVEHSPLVTMGRSGSADNLVAGREGLKEAGVSYHEARRGGDITYHGPGQITLYPVFPLSWWKRDLHWYMRQLEETGIHYLARHGLEGHREKGFTGVWVGEEKISAIGIAVRHWIAYYGMAMNIAPRMDHFALIRPCGIVDKGVTSLNRLTGLEHDLGEEMDCLVTAFLEVFEGATLEEDKI